MAEQRLPILELSNISLAFGGVQALSDVSLTLKHQEILSIIGPNGAGKSSLLNVISGIYKPQAGSIRLKGERLRRPNPRYIALRGVARTFQNLSLFRRMTVLENVCAGQTLKEHATILEHALGLPRARNEARAERARVRSRVAHDVLYGRHRVCALRRITRCVRSLGVDADHPRRAVQSDHVAQPDLSDQCRLLGRARRRVLRRVAST